MASMSSMSTMPGARTLGVSSVAGSLGLLTGHLLAVVPVALLALLLLTVLLGLRWAGDRRRAGDAQLLTGLDTDALASQTEEQVAQTLMDLTRVALSADAVLVTVTADDGDLSPAVAAALASPGAVRGVSSSEAFVGLRWGADGDVGRAVVRIRRTGGAPPLQARDLHRLTLLGRAGELRLHAATAAARQRRLLLQADRAGDAARALGDLGPSTGPVLKRLQALTERVDVVAEAPDADPGLRHLAGQLRAAERTVAALAGAVALHGASAAPLGDATGVPVRDAGPGVPHDLGDDLLADAWTSTGTADAFAGPVPVAVPSPRRAAEDDDRARQDRVVLP